MHLSNGSAISLFSRGLGLVYPISNFAQFHGPSYKLRWTLRHQFWVLENRLIHREIQYSTKPSLCYSIFWSLSWGYKGSLPQLFYSIRHYFEIILAHCMGIERKCHDKGTAHSKSGVYFRYWQLLYSRGAIMVFLVAYSFEHLIHNKFFLKLFTRGPDPIIT